MFWIAIILTSYFFWSLVNIGDKYVVSNRVSSPYVYLVWLSLLGALSVVLIPFIDFFVPDMRMLLWIFLAAVFYFFGGLPYVKSLQIEDITRINIWWNLIPFFTLIISWLVLDEKLTATQLAAFVILASGSIVASLHFKYKNLVISKALPLMIVAGISYASYAVIFRYITQTVPFAVAFVYYSMFVALLSLTLFSFKKFRLAFAHDIKNANLKLGGTVLGLTIMEQLGILFNVWALSLGPAAIVFAMEGTQTIFVFFLAVIISLYYPKVLKEELDKGNIILKLVAIVLIVIGVVIINL